MDAERATLTKALTEANVASLSARGVEARHFSDTPSGRECSEVFLWATASTRKYAQSPSMQMVKTAFPDFRLEPSTDTLEALVDEMLDEVRRRLFQSKLIELAELSKSRENRSILDELMLDAARDISTIVPSGSSKRLSQMPERHALYVVEAAQDRKTGLSMGIPVFDDVTYGIKPGKVYTLAGFSSRGKSTLSTWMTVNVVDQQQSALILSLEMAADEIFERIDTMVMGFSNKALNRRELDPEVVDYWGKVAKQYAKAKNDLVVVDKLGGCSIDRIYAEIQRYRPAVTVVDYIQRMGGSNGKKRWETLDEAANDLKTIALQTESAIIVCSQDTREAAQHGSTETSGAGSIAIFQASDVYIGMQQTEDQRADEQVELRMLKNRGAPRVAETLLHWEPDIMRFSPWESRAQVFTR